MAIDSITGNAAPQVTGAIQRAAQSTGVSFQYLLTTAQIESNLNPAAQAPTSTARGLYQFIDQTWLATMKQNGPAIGLGRYADAITRAPDGRYDVSDSTMRTAIMRLRADPTASAMLAGAFTRNNAEQLTAALGRQPSEGELYIAHFLGPDGASKLIGAATREPQANAAAMFPTAAAANRSIFYDQAGKMRSVSAVYAKLTGRFEMARAIQFAPDIASPVTGAVARRVLPAGADTAGITQVYAAANPAPAVDSAPLFQAMFTNRNDAPVAPAVTSLWTQNKNDSGSQNVPARGGLNLFTDTGTNARKIFGNS